MNEYQSGLNPSTGVTCSAYTYMYKVASLTGDNNHITLSTVLFGKHHTLYSM